MEKAFVKPVFAVMVALCIVGVAFAGLHDVPPPSLQWYLDEQAYLEHANKNSAALSSYKPRFAPPRMVRGVEMMDAFIDIDNPAVTAILKEHGVIVNCVFDDFVTAQVPLNRLNEVSCLPGVSGLEVSQLLELCTDSTLSVTHAGQVLNGPDYGLEMPYDGSGVIIGVIDNGFDYQHSAFKCADDPTRSRIVRVYDPNSNKGHPVVIDGATLPGSVFMDEQINTLTTDDIGSHGTHVASIAAGTHVNGYGGMAPGADIVLCVSPSLNMGVQETEVVNNIKYIFAYADSVGKPCVINVSVSTPHGARDGNDRIAKAVAQLSGPGHIFVIAAGNTGGRNLYTHSPVTMDKPLHMLLSYVNPNVTSDPSYYYTNFWTDTWVRGKNQRAVVAFHIFDRQTRRIVWESELIKLYRSVDLSEIDEYFAPDYSLDSIAYVKALVSLSTSGKYEVTASIHNMKCKDVTVNEADGTLRSRYQFGLTVYAPRICYPQQPDSVYVDSWLCATQSGRLLNDYSAIVDSISPEGDTISVYVADYYTKPSDLVSIGTYAVHDSVISVGAFIGRNSHYSFNLGTTIVENATVGAAYGYSSYEAEGYGPTGKALPTVMAPGYCVVAAGSRYSYFQTNHSNKDLVMQDDMGCPWGIMSGTSMAAPTVAGIIAQWLQIKPDLSPGDVKQIIAQTAVKDGFYSQRFGPNGKIDAMAGVQYLLQASHTEILPGDVDGSGKVDITDVTMLINYLLNNYCEGLNPEAADYDGDGLIDIVDVTSLINYLLNC
ncbi:MAG: S8 family serine peptidase [Muribaculaceae bacterium]|nr:S8 family serine peptidase [Muribaculaceae bacterium]